MLAEQCIAIQSGKHVEQNIPRFALENELYNARTSKAIITTSVTAFV